MDGPAALVEEAPLPLVGEYLRLLKPLRVRLATALQGSAWLAYPANEADARRLWEVSEQLTDVRYEFGGVLTG